MKRHLLALVLIAAMGTLSWSSAQTARADLFDARKSQQELEVMRGIIGTTLNFVAREMQQKEPGSRPHEEGLVRAFAMGNNVNALYFYGQGATFIVPVSRFGYAHLAGFHGMEEGLIEAEASMEEAREGLEAQAEALAEFGASSSSGTPAPTPPPPPPAPVAAPAAPAAPAPPAVVSTGRATRPARNMEESRKRLAEAQERVKVRRLQTEKMRQRVQEYVQQMKGYLVEAIANHGDSLTHVRPNEYINVVISADGEDFFGGDGQKEIISVQKSTITDYKAGRLTLDAFKQKVLQYSE
jgi:hypothetical protein